MPIGAGGCPAGSSSAGYGVPDSAAVPNNALLPLPANGLPQTGRALNPTTKSYSFTTDGRVVGCPTVQQLVQLALTTIFNSSAQAGLGSKLSLIQEKGSDYGQQVTAAITDALADLVKDKLVQIVSVTVLQPSSSPDAGIAVLQWIDLTTGQQSPLLVGP